MIENQRPYQLMLSKTGIPALSKAVALGAKACGVGLCAVKGLFARGTEPLPEEACDRALLSSLCPKPAEEPLPVPPLPPEDGQTDVTVIVPAYNAEKYIQPCVESILGQQTEYALQLVLVDDASADRTRELVQSYAGKENVTVVHLAKPQGGSAAKARNVGLLQAKGRYVMFVDSDDCLAPGAVQTLLDAARAMNADIVQGAWQYMDENSCAGAVQRYVPGLYTESKRLDCLDLPGMPWGKIYRRALFEDVRFPSNYTCFEDAIIHFLIFRKAARIAVVSDMVYLWRKNSAGITATNQHKPAAVQSYWVVEELLRQDAQLRLPHDALYARSLTMQLSNFCYVNVAGLAEDRQRAVFFLCCRLFAANVPAAMAHSMPYAIACGAKALKKHRFRLWQLQGQLYQLMR